MSDQTTGQSGQEHDSGWQETPGGEAPRGASDKDDQATREALDELKAALAQLATAATKVGQIAQVKAREEWKTTKPELQRAIEEMKRGLESAATRASATLDNLAKKVDRPGPDQAQSQSQGQPEPPADEQPRRPEQPPPPTV